MTPLSSFTYRNWLIAVHDAGVTAIAVILSFFLRFDGENLLDRLPLLLKILPYFVAFKLFRLLHLPTHHDQIGWFISIPDLLNIIKAASLDGSCLDL